MCVAESRDITYKGYIMAEETSKPDQFTQNAHVVFPNLCISQERKCMLKNYVKNYVMQMAKQSGEQSKQSQILIKLHDSLDWPPQLRMLYADKWKGKGSDGRTGNPEGRQYVLTKMYDGDGNDISGAIPTSIIRQLQLCSIRPSTDEEVKYPLCVPLTQVAWGIPTWTKGNQSREEQ